MKIVRYADFPELRAIRHDVLSRPAFPEYLHNNAVGDHIVPGMLAPLHVSDSVGRHVEPNVWLRHSVGAG